MERKAVGLTGRLWRRVSSEEREAYRLMAEDGFSFRDIGLKFNRAHRTVSYNLKDDKDRLQESEKTKERRRAKKRKPVAHVLLQEKLGSCLQQARKRAERKNLPIDIDMRFLLDMYESQQGLCALTGLKMETTSMPEYRANPYAISLDRIDSSVGYTRDNVRLVIWCINWSIGEWGELHFEKIAKTYLARKYGVGLLDLGSP